MRDGKPPGPTVDTIRQAFARGESAAGEALLAAALEAGMPWDVATRAVAEGVARHYRRAASSPAPDTRAASSR